MSSLTPSDIKQISDIIEKTTPNGKGFVWNFTNDDFKVFILSCTGKDIYNKKYAEYGESKIKRLKKFLEVENDVNIKKYDSLIDFCENKEEKNQYEFWCKLYIDEFFVGISSLYDKSAHIMNYIYKLNQKVTSKFCKDIMDELKVKDVHIYSLYKSIFDEYEKEMGCIRNNTMHNFSEMFPNVYYIEDDIGRFSWKRGEELTIIEGLNKIEALIVILKKQKELIETTLEKDYKKGNENV